MAAFTFEKAARRKVAPKLAIQGVSGAGKTYSALRFARGYVGKNGRIAFIDTENGSASLYADLTPFVAGLQMYPPRSSAFQNQ